VNDYELNRNKKIVSLNLKSIIEISSCKLSVNAFMIEHNPSKGKVNKKLRNALT